MIGCEYNGEIFYIRKFEDFEDLMEPEVYEALRRVHECGILYSGDEYDELQDEFIGLQNKYDDLESESNNQKYENDGLKEQLDEVVDAICETVNDFEYGYIKTDDVIDRLKNIANEFS